MTNNNHCAGGYTVQTLYCIYKEPRLISCLSLAVEIIGNAVDAPEAEKRQSYGVTKVQEKLISPEQLHLL